MVLQCRHGRDVVGSRVRVSFGPTTNEKDSLRTVWISVNKDVVKVGMMQQEGST